MSSSPAKRLDLHSLVQQVKKRGIAVNWYKMSPLTIRAAFRGRIGTKTIAWKGHKPRNGEAVILCENFFWVLLLACYCLFVFIRFSKIKSFLVNKNVATLYENGSMERTKAYNCKFLGFYFWIYSFLFMSIAMNSCLISPVV